MNNILKYSICFTILLGSNFPYTLCTSGDCGPELLAGALGFGRDRGERVDCPKCCPLFCCAVLVGIIGLGSQHQPGITSNYYEQVSIPQLNYQSLAAKHCPDFVRAGPQAQQMMVESASCPEIRNIKQQYIELSKRHISPENNNKVQANLAEIIATEQACECLADKKKD